ncbi:MAG: hypothetical protein ACJAS4_003248 [Bacteriovoracaceae bacterium]|jgi:hypothetical protein
MMKYLATLLTITLYSFNSFALELKVEPVYGFERTFQQTPKPSRYKTETFVGIRGTYGTEHFAGELEINQAHSAYSVGVISTKTNTQNVLLGIRLMPFNKDFYNIFFRGGMRAKRESREITQEGNSSVETDAIQYDPYAGSGITLNLGGLFSLNASATLVYNRDANPGEQYDSRYTFGAAFKFGNKSF